MDHPNLPADRIPAPFECRAMGGFSSRLRVLASAIAWAILRLRTYVHILWMAELDIFAAPATSVFDLSTLPYWIRIQDSPYLPHTGWLTARPIQSSDDMEAYVEVMGDRPLRIQSGKQFIGNMFLTECMRIFKPAPSVEDAVQAAFNQIIGRTLVGVHYRKGTATQSPQTAFWAAMGAAVAADPSTLFYVAADDPSFVEAAQLRFPFQTTVGFKQAKDANNPEGNEQAAIDFFALARTTRILGSAGSGFGQLAAQYGGIEYLELLAQ